MKKYLFVLLMLMAGNVLAMDDTNDDGTKDFEYHLIRLACMSTKLPLKGYVDAFQARVREANKLEESIPHSTSPEEIKDKIRMIAILDVSIGQLQKSIL